MNSVSSIWPYLAGAVDVALAVLASGHAILHKREVRAAIGWVGLAWLAPFAGPLLYFLLGVNRISRRGTQIQETMQRLSAGRAVGGGAASELLPEPQIEESLRPVESVVNRVTRASLTTGNRVEPLIDGDETYPSMVSAIDEARKSVGLCTYIFDYDAAGRPVVDALERAVRRRVAVRVLLDGAGALYGKPRTHHVLRERGIPAATFLSRLLPWKMPYLNLRNHRKILVVDGRTGFTGGMNIREGGLRSVPSPHRTRDLHFRLEGPVVLHLVDAFARDWAFTTGERLEGEAWHAVPEAAGSTASRGIPDGPDDDFERLHWTLLAGLAGAQRHVRILTPYFLPDQALVSALNVTALRGVRLDIVLPEANNLRVVGWAMRRQLGQVMESGCRVWLTPPPFDHSKLMLVDDSWSLFGSGNWDPRSLRLNFEFNVECYDRTLTTRLDELVHDRIARARPLAISELERRSLPVKLRDGVAWLFSPYL